MTVKEKDMFSDGHFRYYPGYEPKKDTSVSRKIRKEKARKLTRLNMGSRV